MFKLIMQVIQLFPLNLNVAINFNYFKFRLILQCEKQCAACNNQAHEQSRADNDETEHERVTVPHLRLTNFQLFLKTIGPGIQNKKLILLFPCSHVIHSLCLNSDS